MFSTELTIAETKTLARHEATIERGLTMFFEVGAALLAIRDGRLYRKTHPTFQAYCRERWDMDRTRAHRIIDASEVRSALLPMGNILPANERQARPLMAVPVKDRIKVWKQVVASAPMDENGTPRITSAAVEQAVTQYKYARRKKQLSAVPTSGAGYEFILGDCNCLPFQDDHFDLALCSPPYEGQRSYAEIDFNKTGQEWVDWAVPRFVEHLRVCKGLVAWVVDSPTKDFRWSQTPYRLAIALEDLGFHIRKPPAFHRQGIPGSGGPDWLRNDYEFVICATKHGRLPWSDNTAMGRPPEQFGPRLMTQRDANDRRDDSTYHDPEISNPGNVISGKVGNGCMGWQGSHENEAPFPEWLVEFFVRSFCPPGGIVFDGFSGSGTTVAVAVKHGRNGVGMDIRRSQVELGSHRLESQLTIEAPGDRRVRR